jgi:hypothetical protein
VGENQQKPTLRRKWKWIGHTHRKPPGDITGAALESEEEDGLEQRGGRQR